MSTLQPSTRQSLEVQLCASGVREDDQLIVHASLRSMGPVAGGAAAVVQALLGSIGPGGTLLMPVFSDPQPDGVFDVVRTPSRVGYLTEHFRRHTGVLRSLHPTHSVALHGPDAQALVEGHEHLGGLGVDSPIHRLAQRGAKILMVGCDLAACSAIHVAESLERCPWLGKVCYPGYDQPLTVVDGHRPGFRIEPRDPPTCSAGFVKLEAELRHHGLLRELRFGQAHCLVLLANDVIDLARDLLRSDKAALLCGQENCPVCPRARLLC